VAWACRPLQAPQRFLTAGQCTTPAHRLLRHYKHRGAPVKFSSPPWTRQQIQRALSWSPHESAYEYLDYLTDEFVDMINKGQWIVLPYSAVKHLPGLCISPLGVIPQRDRHPCWIVDYSWWAINDDTLPLAAMESMQFGHALDCILREILLANPAFGPVHLIKLNALPSTLMTTQNWAWHSQRHTTPTRWWPFH
jgi:hypothetical protein